jgi:hypothetical protein
VEERRSKEALLLKVVLNTINQPCSKWMHLSNTNVEERRSKEALL